MKLSGREQEKIRDALLDAFPRKPSLEQMLLYKLNKNLDVIAGGDNLQVIVYNLITIAVAEGWIENLLQAACDANPGNSELKTVAKKLLKNNYKKRTVIFKPAYQNKLSLASILLIVSGCFPLVLGGGYAYWQSQSSQKDLLSNPETTPILSSDNQNNSSSIPNTQPIPTSSPSIQPTPTSKPNIQSTPESSLDIPLPPINSPNIQSTQQYSNQNKDELKSDREVNYTQLQELLAAGNWSQADKETQNVMSQAIGAQVGHSISYKKLLSFPCTDLRTIDNLWKK